MRALRGRARVWGSAVVALVACEPQLPPPGPGVLLQPVVGQGQSGVVGQTLDEPLVVRVTDPYDRPVPFVSVHFEVGAGAGSLGAALVETDTAGLAQAVWTLGLVAGSAQEVVAFVGDTPEADSMRVWFTAEAVAGAPATLRAVTPYEPVGTPGQPIDEPFAVLVEDVHGNPVPNATIAWTVMSGGGSLGASDTVTNADGMASATWALGPGVNALGAGVVASSVVPLNVPGHLTRMADSISAGSTTSCALASAAAWCWGTLYNGFSGPTAAVMPPGRTMVSVSAGWGYHCGIAQTAEAFCWGSASYAQLGDSLPQGRPDPFWVAGEHDVQSIDAGSPHTCAIGVDGMTRCWGATNQGEVGMLVGGSLRPTLDSVPRPLPMDPGFANVSVGGIGVERASQSFSHLWWHACGLMADGSLLCWGRAGDGGMTPVNRSPGGRSFAQVSVGGQHFCARMADGLVFCPGDATLPVATEQRFVTISAGGAHTCGLTAGGEAWCWGDNDAGQLGTGDSVATAIPIPVRTGVRFTAISAGASHTCGRSVGGVIFCWGSNTSGQSLGMTGVAPATPAPVRIPSP